MSALADTAARGAIIDAGPALTFFARKDTTRLLFEAVGRRQLMAPETVEQEVKRKASQDKRFRSVEGIWNRAAAGHIQLLSDDLTPELQAAAERLSRMPWPERRKQRRDLGELMVIAHAAVRAEQGEAVTVLIQEQEGTRMALKEAHRINRVPGTGSLTVWDTPRLLQQAVARGAKAVATRTDLAEVYDGLRRLDDGLPPIAQTPLLNDDFWAKIEEHRDRSSSESTRR